MAAAWLQRHALLLCACLLIAHCLADQVHGVSSQPAEELPVAPQVAAGPEETAGGAAVAATPPDPPPSPLQPAGGRPDEAGSAGGQPSVEQAKVGEAAGSGSPPPGAEGEADAALSQPPQQQQPAGQPNGTVAERPPGASTEPEPAAAEAAAEPGAAPPAEQRPPAPEEPPKPTAEPELLEELHNFALTKDGAKVVQANKEAKKLVALLDGDSDTYVKNDCRADKWFIIELSQVAKIQRVELHQYELYSSRVKGFEVRGRQTHPRVDGVELSRGLNSSSWKLLGNLTAENKKGFQLFSLDKPMWVRYLLLQILSHYGSEPMCAINGFAAYGKSAAEEFEDHLAAEEALHYLHVDLEQPEELAQQAQQAAQQAPQQAQQQQAQQQEQPARAVSEAAGATPPTTLTPPTHGTGAEPRQGGAGAQQAEQDGAAIPQQQQQQQEEQPKAVVAEGEAGAPAVAEGAAQEAQAAGKQQNCTAEGSCLGEPTGEGGAASPPKEQPGAAAGGAAGPAAAAVAGTSALGASEAEAEQHTGADGPKAADSGAAAKSEETVPARGKQEPGPASDAPAAPPLPKEAGAAAAAEGRGGTAAAEGSAGGGGKAEQAAAGTPAPAPAPDAGGVQPAAAQPAAGQQLAAEPTGQPAPQQQQQAVAAVGGEEEEDMPPLRLAHKPKASTSVYDVLLQEIKGAKVQQKLAAKSLAELQRNVTASAAELASEVAALAAQLAKVQQDGSALDALVLARVEALVGSRLQRMSQDIAALQAAAAASATRELAVTCLLGMLGAAVVLSVPSRGLGGALLRWAVALLALGNGTLSLLLQYRSGVGIASVLQSLAR